jgi:glycosyltransferase involved in cell wall biosynthesis
MKILYASNYDSLDKSIWSGLGYHIRACLSRAGLEMVPYTLPLIPCWLGRILNLKKRFVAKMGWGLYIDAYDPMLARFHSSKVDVAAAQLGADAIVSPGSLPVAFCNSPKPLAIWCDATAKALFQTYPAYTNLSWVTRREADVTDRSCLRRAAAAVYTSDWAAESAEKDYGADSKKVHVVPFGANIEQAPSPEEVQGYLANRDIVTPTFLFAGVDWLRKGGDFVVEAISKIREAGCAARLRVMGCEVPETIRKISWVSVDGFVDKHSSEGGEVFSKAFAEAFALFLPSLAECYGLVYCEANAYAVPAVGRNVGGVGTIIRDGVNGLLLPTSTSAAEAANQLLHWIKNPEAYREICRKSRLEYERRLNWDVAGERMAEIIMREVEKRRGI